MNRWHGGQGQRIADPDARLSADETDECLTVLRTGLEQRGLTRAGMAMEHAGSGRTVEGLVATVRSLAEHDVALPLVESTTADWILSGAGHPLVDRCTVAHLPRSRGYQDVLGAELDVAWAGWASHVLLIDAEIGGTAALVNLPSPGSPHAGGAGVAPLDRVRLPDDPPVLIPAPPTKRVRARIGALRAAEHVGAIAGIRRALRHLRDDHVHGGSVADVSAAVTALADVWTRFDQAETALRLIVGRMGRPGELAAVAAARVVCGAAAAEVARLTHRLHLATGLPLDQPLARLEQIRRIAGCTDLPEEEWAEILGGAALDGGETAVWHGLSTPGPAA